MNNGQSAGNIKREKRNLEYYIYICLFLYLAIWVSKLTVLALITAAVFLLCSGILASEASKLLFKKLNSIY